MKIISALLLLLTAHGAAETVLVIGDSWAEFSGNALHAYCQDMTHDA